jgi:hypothetical protein
MDTSIIKLATQKKYSEFAKEIRSELAKRLLNDPIIKEYNRRIDYYKTVRDNLNNIPRMDSHRV